MIAVAASIEHVIVGRQRRHALLVSLVLAATVLVPHVVVSRIALGVDDALALVLLAILPLALLARRNARLAPMTVLTAYLWVAIIVHGCLMGLAATLQYFGQPAFPTEMWQYLKRLAFFYAAFFIASTRSGATEGAYKGLVVVLLLATLVGALQIGHGSVSQALSSLYARTDDQLEGLVGRTLATRRIYGVAGNSGAWGGFCVFVAATALPLVLVRGEATRQGFWRGAAWSLLILAVVNLLFSASRGPLVAFLVVLLLKAIIEVTIRGGGFRALAMWLAAASAMTALAFYFAIDRIALLAFRLLTLVEQGGGKRVDEVSIALSLLDSTPALVTGVGNSVQRAYGTSYGVEVEPVYLLVNYGVIGVVCRYGLLLLVAWCALGLSRHRDPWESAAGVAALLAVAGYAIFSLGYFFFQEQYVGLLPWLLFGMVAGLHQRAWLDRRATVC